MCRDVASADGLSMDARDAGLTVAQRIDAKPMDAGDAVLMDVTFVLTHFSHRWTAQEIRDFFSQENIPNIMPWIPAEDIGT